jgi:acetoacetate decarboxylase
VERNGIDVLTLTTPYKQKRSRIEDALEMFDFVTNINLKVVPNIDGTDAIRQLTARELGEITVHECWVAAGTVELRPNAQAPVYRLPVEETIATYHWRCDFTLDVGRVLFDYTRSGEAA